MKAGSEKANSDKNKRPEADLRSFVELGAAKSIRCSGFGSGLLDRLVGVARQTGIHLTEFRQLGNMGFINHSGVLRLDLDHLPERLCTKQLFESTGAVLERLLRISGNLCGNSLEPLVRLSKGADSGIEAVLAGSLNLITKPLNVRHLVTSLTPPCGMLPVAIHMGCYSALHNRMPQIIASHKALYRAEHKEASMRDRKALKAITNAIMKAHVDDPARQHVMDKAKAEQFAKAALKGLHKAGFVVMKRGVMGA
jgi:hypothetical protein